MLNQPAIWPKRRIARNLAPYQWRLIDVMCGRLPAHELDRLVWSFLTDALGHANECLFDSSLISNVDDISIPGGEDESNRFLVEIVSGDANRDREVFDHAIGACTRHRVRWLMWTDGRFWNVAHVLGESAVPAPFFGLDVLVPPSRMLLSQLFVLSLEGMLGSALERNWRNAAPLAPTQPLGDFSGLTNDDIRIGDGL